MAYWQKTVHRTNPKPNFASTVCNGFSLFKHEVEYLAKIWRDKGMIKI
jgi:hypothetical protein